ncbi:MAG: GHMP kinase [Acidobacteriota bacterium]
MILTRAPLRLSFFGGGSDFPEIFTRQPGAVLSTAIDYASYVSLRQPPVGVFEHPIRLYFEDNERHHTPESIRHPLVRHALSNHEIDGPIDLRSGSDLPSGLGLGSSSSFTVALLGALETQAGRPAEAMDLAQRAIELERQVSNSAVGFQDQVMVALGGLRRIEFRAEDDIRPEPLPIDDTRIRELEACLLLVLVGGSRPAPDLERRKLERVERNRDTLRGMVEQVDQACDLLCGGGSLMDLGPMLDTAWRAKRTLAPGVSTPEIDTLYDTCLEAGALGGKMLGAGAGGFLLLFVPPERADAVATAAGRPTLRPRIAQPGFRVLHKS